MGTLLGAIAFAVLLLLAIFFHELGHYLTARWAGIKIRQFFVGFGPTLWSFRRGRMEVAEGDDGELVERPETEYGVKALPLGGFVKVVGMSPFEDVPPQDVPRSFTSAPAWKRAIVLCAGSVTHVITAFLVLWLIFSAIGMEDPNQPTLRIDTVYRQTTNGAPAPAFEAGLRPGDEIVALDGRNVSSWEAGRSVIRNHPGETIQVTVREPGGDTRTLPVTPAVETDDGQRIGVIGVSPAFAVTRVNPVVGLGRSARYVGQALKSFVTETPKAFTLRNLGLQPGAGGERTAVSVVGAGRIAAGLAARGQVVLFLLFFLQVNLFIGLINMLPLPPLDGGHLLLLGIEKVRGKQTDPRKLVPVMAVVTSLLVILAVSLLFQDIFSPVRNPFQ